MPSIWITAQKKADEQRLKMTLKISHKPLLSLFNACTKHSGCFVSSTLFNVSRRKTDSPTAQSLKKFPVTGRKSVLVQYPVGIKRTKSMLAFEITFFCFLKNSIESTFQVFSKSSPAFKMSTLQNKSVNKVIKIT